MKTWVGWGGEAGALVTNCCNTVLPAAVAASCSLLTSSGAVVRAGWLWCCGRVLPLCQHCRGSWIHHSIQTVEAVHIDSCYKSYRQGCFCVFRPTLYFKAVYYVFIYCSCGYNYHPCVSCKSHVLIVLQTPANCGCLLLSCLLPTLPTVGNFEGLLLPSLGRLTSCISVSPLFLFSSISLYISCTLSTHFSYLA